MVWNGFKLAGWACAFGIILFALFGGESLGGFFAFAFFSSPFIATFIWNRVAGARAFFKKKFFVDALNNADLKNHSKVKFEHDQRVSCWACNLMTMGDYYYIETRWGNWIHEGAKGFYGDDELSNVKINHHIFTYKGKIEDDKRKEWLEAHERWSLKYVD